MKDLEFTKNEKVELIYDIVAGILAVIAVLVVMMEFADTFSEREEKIIREIDTIIYIIFVLDYFIRMIFSKNKKRFLKHNLIDLIAILPFGIFSFVNYGSAYKLIRVVTYVLRLFGNIQEILFTNGFIYAFGLVILITIIGSIGIFMFEYKINDGIKSYEDSLWWAIVTVTTVGYGDIVILTRGGRIIACILMVTGIAFLGMFTSTMSTFFFSKLDERSLKIEKDIRYDKRYLDISDLCDENKSNLINYYRYLKSCEKEKTK